MSNYEIPIPTSVAVITADTKYGIDILAVLPDDDDRVEKHLREIILPNLWQGWVEDEEMPKDIDDIHDTLGEYEVYVSVYNGVEIAF